MEIIIIFIVFICLIFISGAILSCVCVVIYYISKMSEEEDSWFNFGSWFDFEEGWFGSRSAGSIEPVCHVAVMSDWCNYYSQRGFDYKEFFDNLEMAGNLGHPTPFNTGVEDRGGAAIAAGAAGGWIGVALAGSSALKAGSGYVFQVGDGQHVNYIDDVDELRTQSGKSVVYSGDCEFIIFEDVDQPDKNSFELSEVHQDHWTCVDFSQDLKDDIRNVIIGGSDISSHTGGQNNWPSTRLNQCARPGRISNYSSDYPRPGGCDSTQGPPPSGWHSQSQHNLLVIPGGSIDLNQHR